MSCREAVKQAYIYAIVFAFSQAVIYLMYAGAFRFGAYLIGIGDMSPTDVYRWVICFNTNLIRFNLAETYRGLTIYVTKFIVYSIELNSEHL